MLRPVLARLAAALILFASATACGRTVPPPPRTPTDSGDAAARDAGDAGDATVGDAGDATVGDAGRGAMPLGVLHTDLTLDLGALHGRAVVDHAPAESIVFEVGGLTEVQVFDGSGAAVDAPTVDGQISLPGAPTPTQWRFEYTFPAQPRGTLEGWVPESNVTLLWPYHCSNLFPCVSSPADGTTFALSVTGTASGLTAVYPRTIAADAPSYMIAVAVGEYEVVSLGTTRAGTHLSVYHFPGERASATEGTGSLVGYVEFFETTYGPYLFGDEMASVAVNWGAGGFGGMEHHPFFHVARPSMANPVTQAHEAAHGWFGNGVRIRCWEDFVLSEGLATYLAARAIAAVDGPEAEARVWAGYEVDLTNTVARRDTEAWPTGCGEIDIVTHPVFSLVPYMKGAFFMRAIEREIGRDALDAILADFYRRHGGAEAASMGELLEDIETRTGFDTTALTDAWLRGLGIPPLP
ncbi:MAG: peptidase M1 [Deltaproteobacteria bacterium]|nr:MAG: peptidase M1 [Deltaproteobacteria bacterium]